MDIPEIARKRSHILDTFDNPKVLLGEITPQEIYEMAIRSRADLWTVPEGTGYMLGYIRGESYTVQNCVGDFKWSPDQWRKAMGMVEDNAKSLGLTEVYIQGRLGWSRLFPDYDKVQVKLKRTL